MFSRLLSTRASCFVSCLALKLCKIFNYRFTLLCSSQFVLIDFGSSLHYCIKLIRLRGLCIKKLKKAQQTKRLQRNNVLLSFQEFQGNSDQKTVVTNNFKKPIVARYVRIIPQTYTYYAEIRVEYYGCRIQE